LERPSPHPHSLSTAGLEISINPIYKRTHVTHTNPPQNHRAWLVKSIVPVASFHVRKKKSGLGDVVGLFNEIK
jgi:hypothetical protein